MNNTATYSISADGIADLALPVELDQRLNDALDSDHGTEIRFAIDEAITAKLQEHGVDDEGVWLGEWDAAAIVTEILDRYTATITMTSAEHTANILGTRPFLVTPRDDNEGTIHTLGRREIARFKETNPDWDGHYWAYDRSQEDHPMVPVNVRD